jgi:hypothetical protein
MSSSLLLILHIRYTTSAVTRLPRLALYLRYIHPPPVNLSLPRGSDNTTKKKRRKKHAGERKKGQVEILNTYLNLVQTTVL